MKASACTFPFHPVSRAVQAAVCKTAYVGAIPTRDSICPSIGVERGHESASLSVGSIFASVVKLLSSLRPCASTFERRVCRWESCRMHQFTGMWLNPNSRGFRLRIWQPWGCNSLHAHHLTATGFSGKSRPRRLKIAEPSGCKSRVADRRVVNREQQTGSTQDRTALGVQVSPHRPIWNVNRTSEPDLFAKQWAP